MIKPRFIRRYNYITNEEYYQLYIPGNHTYTEIRPSMLFYADREMRNRIILAGIDHCTSHCRAAFTNYWFAKCLSEDEKKKLIKKNPEIYTRRIAQAEVRLRQAEEDYKDTLKQIDSKSYSLKYSTDEELKAAKNEINAELRRRKNVRTRDETNNE